MTNTTTNTLTITTTAFDSNYHGAQAAGSRTYACGLYVLHNIDVYNEIVVGETRLRAVYQTAQYYMHQDYNCPDYDLALSSDGDSSWALVRINQLSDSDFEENGEAFDILEEISEIIPEIVTINDLRALYDALNDNLPLLSSHLTSEQEALTYDDLAAADCEA